MFILLRYNKRTLNYVLIILMLVPLVNGLYSSSSQIQADAVWDLGINGSGQTICVIDSGVDYTHTSLGGCTQAQFLAGTCDKVIGGYNYYDNNADPMDLGGHGTHIAGIISSTSSK